MAVDQVSDPTNVQIVTPPATVEAQPPATNPALQLAEAMRGQSANVNSALDNLSAHFQRVQSNKAAADAFASSGKPFADAVRDKDIAPTQNPWYVKAYNENAAKLQTRSFLDQQIAESASWPERNDPVAYQQKLNNLAGQFAEQYTDVDSRLGFNEIAQPLVEQASQTNAGYNANRIEKENVQNVTSLATQSVMDQLKANPSATPDQIFQAMEPQHDQWIKVMGGTEPAWRLIVKQAVVGAASNTGRVDILDTLKAPYLGSMPIANQSDETGKPTALELGQDAYWIDRSVDAALNQDYKAHQAQIAGEGAKVDTWANQHYGADFAFGKIPLSQLQQEGTAAGYSPESIIWAADQAGQRLRGAAGYSEAQTAVYSQDPQVQQKILTWTNRAHTEGLTPQLHQELMEAVVRPSSGITLQMAQTIEGEAASRSQFLTGEAHADAREARSLKLAQGSFQLQQASIIKDEIKEAQGSGVSAASRFGIDLTRLPAADQKSYNDTVESAGFANMEKGVSAARDAADNAAAAWVISMVKRKQAADSAAAQTVGQAIVDGKLKGP